LKETAYPFPSFLPLWNITIGMSYVCVDIP